MSPARSEDEANVEDFVLHRFSEDLSRLFGQPTGKPFVGTKQSPLASSNISYFHAQAEGVSLRLELDDI